MNRREIVSALGSMAVMPSLVGTSEAQQPQQHMTPDNQQPGQSADQHMMQTAAIGSLSLLASRIASAHVSHSQLEQFVQFEIAEQNTVSKITGSMNKPARRPQASCCHPRMSRQCPT